MAGFTPLVMSSAVGVGSFGQSSGRHWAGSPGPAESDPEVSGERDGVGLGVSLVDAGEAGACPESSDGISEHPLPTISAATTAKETAHRIARGPRRSIIRRT
ncbi:hypothetical protein GTC6_12378 [Gordonia terrae C-6]|uniref:Uncharacterized protein n=1 Tax=Gordonia terrae C-6 TaxID=1316928 RepID=R7Y8N7_9ACTN|nr:hypothetical protein GTC6_12378 [Gordonia terrae C-6]